MTDPGRYRSRAEEELWRKRDPIPRLAKHLQKEAICDEAKIQEIEVEVEDVCEDAVQFALDSPDPEPGALYEDMFKESYPGDPHA